MRLIDADSINWWKGEDENGNAVYVLDKRDIDKEPTAYDIEKVVKELEGVKMRYFLTIANTGNEKSDFAYENVGNALDKAIEIVKHGGVDDDVCGKR